MNLVDVEDAILYPSIRDTESEKDVEIIYTDGVYMLIFIGEVRMEYTKSMRQAPVMMKSKSIVQN